MTCRRALTLLAGAALAPAAFAFHDGDNVYGAVNGQIVTVDPTDALLNPKTYQMSFVQGASSASLVADVGFDFWDLGGGIETVATARLNGRILTRGLKVRDNLRFFFAPESYYGQPNGATNVRQFFTLSGSSRHKHFSFYTDNVGARKTYEFEYWFTNALDVNGNALADSPRYRLRLVANPRLNQVPVTSPVPEPATVTALGIGLITLRRRRAKKP